jgi:hypothetical protein
VIVAGLVALAFVLGLRQRRPRGSPRAALARGVLPETTAPPTDPRQVAAVWSEGVREELARRFGPTWTARTTEEIAGRPEPESALGEESARRLVEFLQVTDRVKFAGFESSAREAAAQRDALEAWAGWVFSFLAAGARSRISGK